MNSHEKTHNSNVPIGTTERRRTNSSQSLMSTPNPLMRPQSFSAPSSPAPRTAMSPHVKKQNLLQSVAARKARKRVAKAVERGFTELDLGNLDADQVPSEVCQARRLEILSASNNHISRLPTTFVRLTTLRELYLKHNMMTVFPLEVCALVQLETIDFEQNNISNIPSYISNLKNIRTLNLAKNQISYIPEEICDLLTLDTLSLHTNRINRLPVSLCKLKNLRNLYLHSNQLSMLPSSLGCMPTIHTLSIADNALLRKSEVSELAELEGITSLPLFLSSPPCSPSPVRMSSYPSVLSLPPPMPSSRQESRSKTPIYFQPASLMILVGRVIVAHKLAEPSAPASPVVSPILSSRVPLGLTSPYSLVSSFSIPAMDPSLLPSISEAPQRGRMRKSHSTSGLFSISHTPMRISPSISPSTSSMSLLSSLPDDAMKDTTQFIQRERYGLLHNLCTNCGAKYSHYPSTCIVFEDVCGLRNVPFEHHFCSLDCYPLTLKPDHYEDIVVCSGNSSSASSPLCSPKYRPLSPSSYSKMEPTTHPSAEMTSPTTICNIIPVATPAN